MRPQMLGASIGYPIFFGMDLWLYCRQASWNNNIWYLDNLQEIMTRCDYTRFGRLIRTTRTYDYDWQDDDGFNALYVC